MSMSRAIPALLAAAALLTGCTGPASAPEQEAPASGTASPGTSYPVTVHNCGHDVTVKTRPQRIIGLNQSSTETLLALQQGPSIVGTSTWFSPVLAQYAEQNAKIKRIADNNPSLEAVLALDPDLLAATYHADLPGEGSTTFESFAKLGVPVYMAPAECSKNDSAKGDGERTRKLTLDEIYQEVTDLAAITGVPDQGEKVVSELKATVAKLDKPSRTKPLRVVFWFADTTSPYVAGGLGSPQIAADALSLTNVYASSTQEWPQVSWEDVAAKDPDVIVMADLTRRRKTGDSGKEKIAFLQSNPVTAQMRAVKSKHFVFLEGADLNPSIRTVSSMEKLEEGLSTLGLEDAK